MEYRRLGRTGLNVSAISLGTEYLIDLPPEHVATVIRTALDQGINYFDLFFAQAQFRENMGAAFAGQRDRAFLAAHLGASEWDGQYEKTRDVAIAKRYFEDFLTRYKTDYVDVLFLHNSDSEEDFQEIFRPGGLCELAYTYKKEGRARFIGFSGHTMTTSRRAVESNQIDVLMFPLNIISHAIPGHHDLLAACIKYDVGLVAMKPYAGGKLLNKMSLVTPVQCLAYVLAQNGVTTVVPGCKNIDELSAALAFFKASDTEKDFPSEFKHADGECMYCNHCLPCPANIDIGRVMRLADAVGGVTTAMRREYASLMVKPTECLECGVCTERCPFGVDVVPKMKKVTEMFG